MGSLFGTDGVRDVANAGLTPELAFMLGRAGASVLSGVGSKPCFAIGMDTRISSPMLEAAMIAGMTSAGADVLRLGVIPTPAVAYLTRSLGAQAGVVISASHNPSEFNGIKFFGSDGFKLPDKLEEAIESCIMGAEDMDCGSFMVMDGCPRPTGSKIGVPRVIDDAEDRYVAFAAETGSCRLEGLRIVVDCANGAASRVSPAAFRMLGAEVIVLADSPDGCNINADCGSTHPEQLMRAVVDHGADMGFAYDGDADRVVAVGSDGVLVDGDEIMAISAAYRWKTGLPGGALVATPYSNLGLKQAMNRLGYNVVYAKNGDKYVLEDMLKHGLTLGGEQSGHIIFLNHTTTGDGLITSIQLACTAVEQGMKLEQLARVMSKFPQHMENVPVSHKEWLEGNEAVTLAIEQGHQAIGPNGRIMVRASGTEPLVRVMAEGPVAELVVEVVRRIARVVRAELE